MFCKQTNSIIARVPIIPEIYYGIETGLDINIGSYVILHAVQQSGTCLDIYEIIADVHDRVG